jgi:beta-phosphoglucomutase family hydrolase|eukprot:CAMPEP_0174301974 /NCGR_PEP_ID=MMETSP0809-20121228/59367_1 /TAXON_ID=73025 ORGANISM="Eutreptiella gymnastica-like, Strain CCMP1594" /NCGR_SAMPLE_ID=MMETSP0809 /ASSEMBLY_ACC=CAM_ASM_000658 /LENGTH=253 /DNA_ID=CAMNT_0015407825 /DNA_START=18 /DNA_END=779 /DNA_ORIENTATION=-
MPANFDCVVFDLDGVVTQTSKVHTKAWTATFNEYLQKRDGDGYKPFTEEDYLKFVDGKPRYDGVTDFLKSRDITIEHGDPSDAGDKLTVCGIGNRKNDMFLEVLKAEGVEPYDTTVRLLRELEAAGIPRGVASSSKNCQFVLQTAKIEELMMTRVDGVVSAEIGLKGKPQPDIFVTAAKNLGFTPDRTIVFEDAVSGVQAGKNGNFALVVGLAREDNEKELKENGADIVFPDWGSNTIEDLDKWVAAKKAGTL